MIAQKLYCKSVAVFLKISRYLQPTTLLVIFFQKGHLQIHNQQFWSDGFVVFKKSEVKNKFINLLQKLNFRNSLCLDQNVSVSNSDNQKCLRNATKKIDWKLQIIGKINSLESNNSNLSKLSKNYWRWVEARKYGSLTA